MGSNSRRVGGGLSGGVGGGVAAGVLVGKQRPALGSRISLREVEERERENEWTGQSRGE